MKKFGVEFSDVPANSSTMKTVVARKQRTEAQLLDQATKQAMVKKQGRVDHDELRQDGYSDRLLARLRNA